MNTWTNPIVNALKTDDAVVLQQIFSSLSQELGRMNDKIQQLEIQVSKSNRKDYQRIR
jgi:hypothetical protein